MIPCIRSKFRLILFLSTIFFFAVSTMTASVAVCQQIPKDTAVKTKLLKRITEMLQFRRNARKREQQRVITIVNGLFVDSLLATPAAIKYLNWALNNERIQSYAYLRQLLNDSLSKRTADTVFIKDTITDEEMTELAAKLIPLLQQKQVEIKNDTAQQQRLKIIRSLYGRPPDKIDTLRLSDTLGRTYKIRLAHQAAVIGIQSNEYPEAYRNYNFTSLSYLAATPPVPPKILTAAAKNRCQALLTISNRNGLLQDEAAQFELVDSLLPMLEAQQAVGVNVWFKGVKQSERDALTQFVTILSNRLAERYIVMVTIPANDRNKAYDLREMAPLVKYFLINFTEAPAEPGSSDPLKGNVNYSIAPVVSKYINQLIPPDKFVVMLPYNGIKWEGKKPSFVAYSNIKKEYPADSMINYDVTAAAAFVEKTENGLLTQTWFNDPTTMDVKYDYVLRNGLGGVAVYPLGADDGYGELWDELTDKFTIIDTLFIDTVRLVPKPAPELSLWRKLQLRFHHEMIGIDSLLKDPCKTNMARYKSDDYFKYLTIFLFVCALVVGLIYVYQVRMEGTEWKWRKKMLYLLVTLIVLMILSGTINLMLAKRMPLLGLTDDTAECKKISLYNVLVVFLIGIFLGMTMMRIFVFPILRKRDKDIP
ncbi:glycosyl hydrolase family 18 protein [Chitinophaga sp.]|uniref:glycosyl hydrolase family 18 protein n=1 Tax=Chitinophaga sp. TaxID=1869181 RepID=UPI0031D8020C